MPQCEACGTTDHTGTIEYIRVRTTNGGLHLCRQCLDDINRKNPAIPALVAALTTIACGNYDNAHDCKAAAKIAVAAIKAHEKPADSHSL